MVDAPTTVPTQTLQVAEILGISLEQAQRIWNLASEKYNACMKKRFSEVGVRRRINNTNPFMTAVRDTKTVEKWAYLQVLSTFFASEEEAIGHLLEALAKECHIGARPPKYPDGLDYEVEKDNSVTGYQVKSGKDLNSSTKNNLSVTSNSVKEKYQAEGKTFNCIAASCYGRKSTTSPPSHDFTYLSSREFWSQIGNNNPSFDYKIGQVLNLICAEFHREIKDVLAPELCTRLTQEALPLIGNPDGTLNLEKLFRQVNG